MTSKERLRALLDERGIEYTICMPWNDTAWEYDGTHFTATERFGKIYLQTSQGPMTPEQAIAATVGAGTCQIETTESWLPAERYHRCKRCGAFFAVLDASHDIPPRVCPNCGRKVVVE